MPFIGKQPEVGAYQLIDSITTSATATYALTVDGSAYFPASARNLIVSLNGVTQAPESAYTVSGSNIVFDSALTASDVIDYILVIGDAVDIGTPSDGTVGNAQLKSDLDFSGKTLTFSNDQISGDAIDGGTATLDGLTVDTNTLYVDSTNNRVGIGASSPDSKLDVRGTILGGASSPSTGQIAFGVHYGGSDNIANTFGTMKSSAATCIGWGVYGSPSVTEGFVSSVDASLNFRRGALLVDQDELRFLNAGQQTLARDAAVTMTERFKVDASGNLLVGRTSGVGSERLAVQGAALVGTFYSANSTANGTLMSYYSDVGGTQQQVAAMQRDGDIFNANNTYGALSDERLKSNIVDASSQLDDIMAVQVRSYTLNATGNTHIGVVAQELEASGMSGLVSEDENGMKSVKYSVLYMKAIKAIQEQQAMIETLQAQVAELQGAN